MEINTKKNHFNSMDLRYISQESTQLQSADTQGMSEMNKHIHAKSNHKSGTFRAKDDNLHSRQDENMKAVSQSPNRQYLNFPSIDTQNEKKPTLAALQQQVLKKESYSNVSQSLPKLKPFSEFQISNFLNQNHQPSSRKKILQSEWQANEQINYSQGGQLQKSIVIPKNLKPLQQRPRVKQVDQLYTEPNSENIEKHYYGISKNLQEKYKSLLQLRSPSNLVPSSNSPNHQINNTPLIFQIPKKKVSVPYLSSKIEQQQKEQQQQQQIGLKRFNESIDRRFKFSCKTKAGCTADKTPKTNQDNPIIYPKQLGEKGVALFAVCDGHGTNGHHISNLIRKNLPKHLLLGIRESTKKQQKKSLVNESKDKTVEEQNGITNSENQISNSELKSCIESGFFKTNSDVLKCEFDSNLSGSTLVSVFIVGNTILCANVGDSRAIVAKQKFGNEFKAYPLSIDHKPCLERERQRIIQNGGRVQSQKDSLGNPIGPLRVWMNTIDMPGLAMTRSFGDKAGIQAGVSCDPEILESEISEEDKFIVVASDGVWEYLSNQDVIRIVQPYFEKGQVEQAAERLVIESSNAWKRESFSRDDITCIVIFIQNVKEDEEENEKNKGAIAKDKTEQVVLNNQNKD